MAIVHSIAQSGFGIGTNELYDRARPSYPYAALRYIKNAIKLSSPLNIVEIGAGTGIFTRALFAHDQWSSSINQIKAVEPSAGMRDVFVRLVCDSRVSVSEGTFEKTDVNDGWADLVVVAQAFHWCPDYDRASAEFARILKLDGVLALIWNLEDRDKARWVGQLRDRIEKHEAGTPQFRLNLWRQVFESEAYQQFFLPHEEITWSYVLPATAEIAVDRACSKSYIAVLSDAERNSTKVDVEAIVAEGQDKTWIDEARGIFEYPYQTLVVIANRRPG